MKIIETSKDLTKAEIYLLTKSPLIQTVKNNVGKVVVVKAWCKYSDVNSRGNEIELLSIVTETNEIFATNSKTFMKAFQDIIDIFGNDSTLPPITFVSGKTKSDKEFVTCAYMPE